MMKLTFESNTAIRTGYVSLTKYETTEDGKMWLVIIQHNMSHYEDVVWENRFKTYDQAANFFYSAYKEFVNNFIL